MIPSARSFHVMKQIEVPFSSLHLNRQEIYLMMGSDAYAPDPEMVERIEQTIRHIGEWCRPLWGYELYEITAIGKNFVQLGDQTLATGSIITRYLHDAEQLALFVATAGTEFQSWMDFEACSGDILREFIAGHIGSEIAEATVRVMSEALATECNTKGMQIGNPYSPGYCGWNLTGQRTLFEMLPTNPCGITLTDSCLMLPIKSVSGIIPVGTKVRREPYGCAICNSANCYKNNLKKLSR